MARDPDRVRLMIELEATAAAIRGRLDDGHGDSIEFAGWLELMSALEEACERANAAGAVEESA